MITLKPKFAIGQLVYFPWRHYKKPLGVASEEVFEIIATTKISNSSVDVFCPVDVSTTCEYKIKDYSECMFDENSIFATWEEAANEVSNIEKRRTRELQKPQ